MNRICDTCAQNSRRYEICEIIFAYTVVIRRKTFKSAKNTICDTCAKNSRRYEFCDIFVHKAVISRKSENELGTRFVILVQRIGKVITLVTFLLIQL